MSMDGGTGNIGGYFDVAQVVLYLFWGFFASLIFYLHRENKREGYPLDSDRTDRSGGRVQVVGFPPMPKPKTYHLAHGGTVSIPNGKRDTRAIAAEPVGKFPGAPLEPTGDAMLAAVGPGSYAERADEPDLTYDGQLKIVPMRVAGDFSIVSSPDPRGKPVLGADGSRGGVVVDLWVDRSECLLRYLEVDTGSRRVLLPVPFSNIKRDKVLVNAILGRQFAQAPVLRNADSVTLLEEDKICGYYGGGTLYATAERQDPIL
jgi:photosynthetic reaction center H subunit